MSEFVTYDEMKEIVEELCDELPEVFYNELNLGVVLEDMVRFGDISFESDPLYVLGLYSVDMLGSKISIFYGSMKVVYGYIHDREEIKDKVRSTLRHEFTHHLERLAGEKDLEIDDEIRLAKYIQKYQNK